jgi:hypothetical protein
VQTDVERSLLAGVKGVESANLDMFFEDQDFFVEQRQTNARRQSGQTGP